MKNYTQLQECPLNSKVKKQRVEFCKEMLKALEEGTAPLFSDETYICQDRAETIKIWCRRKDRTLPKNVRQVYQHGKFNVMISGGVAEKFRTGLNIHVLGEDTINAA